MASFCVTFCRNAASSNIERAYAWLRSQFPFLLIWGLVLSHSIVEYTTVCLLMIYLTDQVKQYLVPDAVIINILDVLTAVFVFLVAYIGDNFNVIVFSSGCYTMGLIVLCITATRPRSHTDFDIYLAVVLIALGRSSRSSNLQSFLGYQLRHRDRNNPQENREEQKDDSTKIWWHSAWICGYVIVLSVHDHEYSWLKNFKVSALLMGAAAMLFFNLGIMVYDYDKTKPARRVSLGHIFTVLKQIRVTNKSKKLLLCATFIPYGLVLATGNTLFIHQISNLDSHIGRNFGVPAPFFFVVKSVTCDLVVFLFWYFCRSARAKHIGTVTLLRIGVGMVCGVFSCVVARYVEIRRQQSFLEEGILEEPDKTSSLSVLLLTPQYCLLGLMEGLAGGGLFTYILGRLRGSRRRFAEPFSELLTCVGKLISIMFVLLFGFWFEDIDSMQLDRYFLMVAIMNSASFCLYLFWTLKYGDMNSNQEESETTVTEGEESPTSEHEPDYDDDPAEPENPDEVPEFIDEEISNIQDNC